MTRLARTKLIALLVASSALAIGACTNPVGRGGEHPAGIRVRNEANLQVASFRVGGAVIGQMTAVVGTPVTFTLEVVDRNENLLTIDGSDISVVVAVTGGVATAAVQDNNRLLVTPAQAGNGTVDLMVMHSRHEEFTARIPLSVTVLNAPS